MTNSFVPYETLAREEARDITANLPSDLGSLTAEQLVAVQELIADGYGKGLQAGFDMCEFTGVDPATALEIYNAGIVESNRRRSQD